MAAVFFTISLKNSINFYSGQNCILNCCFALQFLGYQQMSIGEKRKFKRRISTITFHISHRLKAYMFSGAIQIT